MQSYKNNKIQKICTYKNIPEKQNIVIYKQVYYNNVYKENNYNFVYLQKKANCQEN